ncbi:VOC family protein [Streptomyces sp. NBC_00056]|uniref:VOC family protein n=1 Tax=unclassified Streptomyces TaxID=2593676 RepID=UPI00225B5613|nr:MULTISPECIES: VOC family protein [unclassified Streptomyces]MCX5439322.1 VOC family protein [Streptomyces sp. NBC_00063]WUB94207.1 VOC family protein [Streptomyces sp. NBC_00569]
MPTSPVPEAYRNAVVAHIMIDGAAAAIDFYAEAFGAVELFRIDGPDGRVVHAEVGVAGSTIMLGDAEGPLFRAPTAAGGTTVGLHVFVDDVDALARRAVAAGAKLLQSPADQFHGDRTAILRDPFGHVWVFLTHLEDLTPDEITRRARDLFR